MQRIKQTKILLYTLVISAITIIAIISLFTLHLIINHQKVLTVKEVISANDGLDNNVIASEPLLIGQYKDNYLVIDQDLNSVISITANGSHTLVNASKILGQNSEVISGKIEVDNLVLAISEHTSTVRIVVFDLKDSNKIISNKV